MRTLPLALALIASLLLSQQLQAKQQPVAKKITHRHSPRKKAFAKPRVVHFYAPANTGLFGPNTGGIGSGMATFRAITLSDLPGGTGTGSVTSVTLEDSTGTFNVTGSPLTTTGTLNLANFANQTAHYSLGNHTNSTGAASWGLNVEGDLPAATVFTDKSNTYSTGVQDLTSATQLKVPLITISYFSSWVLLG